MPDLLPADRPAPLALARLLRPGERARRLPSASRYWATSHGRILSTVGGTASEVRPVKRKNGYLQTDVWFDGEDGRTRRRVVAVHILVAAAFHGPKPDVPGVRIDVDHINRDRADNRPENLRYLTRGENVRRVLLTGEHPSAKLNPVEVWTLRCQALAVGTAAAVTEAEARFGMTTRAVRDALAGRTWSQVPYPSNPVTPATLAEKLSVSEEVAADLLGLAGHRRLAA